MDTASEHISQNVANPLLGGGAGGEVVIPSAYFAPIAFYVPMAKEGKVCIEQHDNFVKQTFRNRCIIAGPNGRQVLTIPVEKNPQGKTPMREIHISNHGNWRHLHWNALESSYGKSPFFEYYADDIEPFFRQHWEFLFDFNEAIRQKMCELLCIEAQVEFTQQYEAPSTLATDVLDMRQLAEPSVLDKLACSPYYQVFASRQGFIPNLSILDLLFNLGPESLIYLNKQTL